MNPTHTDVVRLYELLDEIQVTARRIADENDSLKRVLVGQETAHFSKTRDNRKKLSRREVALIREYHRSGVPTPDIADMFDVNRSTIYRTLKGVYHKGV